MKSFKLGSKGQVPWRGLGQRPMKKSLLQGGFFDTKNFLGFLKPNLHLPHYMGERQLSEMKHEMKNKMIAEYANDYVGKIYYFCLKKTSDSYEAEDLASDITLCILRELEKGTIPMHFSAWVWQIARNRYSAWADGKHKKTEAVSGTDIGEMELPDEGFENSLVHSEELALLRRELAFISSEYRDIVSMFYIEDRKTKDIAKMLGLPEGTVKTRLVRARNILKEGMNMAREFGVKSYRPENISFVGSGNNPDKPHEATERLIPKNILLEASDNPSTIEELSVELGIAVPYMEEEVRLLEELTLLKKLENGKYVTNIYIISAQTQLDAYYAARKNSAERTRLLDEMVCDTIPAVRKLGIVPENMDDAELKWLLMLKAVDFCICAVKSDAIRPIPPRENGDTWSFSGYVFATLPEHSFVGQNGNGDLENCMFWSYEIRDFGMWNRIGKMPYEAISFFGDFVKGKRNVSTLTEAEKALWQEIDGKFAHADENGSIISDIPVMSNAARDAMYALWCDHPHYEKLCEAMQDAFEEILAAYRKNSSAMWEDILGAQAKAHLYHIRWITLRDAVKAGMLTVPKDPKTSRAAMYMTID